MIRIKICGITNKEDAHRAIKLGAHALGFIFFPASPRYISPSLASSIIKDLPPFVSTVGVFVDEDPQKIKKIIKETGINYVQLHGKESPEVCELFSPWVIKAIRIKGERDLNIIERYQEVVKAVLLDTYIKGLPGGTGQSFDWSCLQKLNFDVPIIIAGGLGPDNILQLLEKFRPWAIDICSGIEKAPGKKDPLKMQELFRRLFSWPKRLKESQT